MRKQWNRVLGFALSLLLVAGMLPVSALATGTTYIASVGDVQYETLAEAVEAAKNAEDPAVKLLADLKDQVVALDTAYLVVDGEQHITIENCSFTGKHEDQILLNLGDLILKNVSVKNTEGTYAVFSASDEETTAKLMLFGGSYEGQKYGIGLKEMKLQLNAYAARQENAEAQEQQDVLVPPAVAGKTAAFHLDDSAIELLCSLGEGTSYTVDRTTPGLFAFASEYEGSELNENWFKSIHGEKTFSAADKEWVLSGSIANVQAVGEDDKVFTYNGAEQAPKVSVTLYGKTLTEDHYKVSYTKDGELVEKPVDAGTYVMRIEGKDPYSEHQEITFVISKATPVVTWDKETEQLAYTGKAADLTAKASVKLVNDEVYEGDVDYAYRAGSTGEFKTGLPMEQGTYEVKASVKAFGNYENAETTKLLTVTIGEGSNAKLILEVKTPEGGHVYTGSAICPEVTVKDGETVVPADQYEVFYTNNINVGTATVTVKAKENGSYTFEDMTAEFEIKKATATVLTISGQPASVTYGDKAFQLSVSGGISDAPITWSVAEGGSVVSVSADGKVTVTGVGKATVKAAQSGGAAYNDLSAEVSFDVKPAVLTVKSVDGENKTYDGNKAIKIKAVTLDGIVGSDEVSVAVGSINAELANTKAGIYDKVTVSGLTLAGKDAGKYTLTQPSVPVKTDVTVSKADVPSALAEIKSTVSVDTENLTVENLGVGMPADAGKITYAAKTQDTSDGSEVIVLDWNVDENGKLTSKVAAAKAGDQVIYDVTVSSENYKDTVVRIVVTMGSLSLEASKVTVTPAESTFTYDGKEHKPAVEVKYGTTVLKADTDYTVTYPKDCTAVGEKELTVTFKGNYSGTATAKYTVSKAKVTVSGVQAQNKTYDGTTKATVTATLSGVISGDDVKVTAAGTFADKNSGSKKTINVTYTLTGKDAGNYELTATTGTTTATISPISVSSVNGRISGLSTANADSGDKAALQNVVSQVNTALQDTGLSSGEKSGLSNVKWSAEDMISRIESAAAAASTESVRKSADITKENVTLNDKALLEKAQSDLNSALTTYSGNYTAAEEKEIQSKKTRIADALAVITRVQSAQTLIDTLPAQFAEDTVIDPALKTSVKDAKEVFDGLSEYEKKLLGEDAALKLTAAVDAAGKLPTDDGVQDDANTLISSAPEEGETFKFPTWILVVAVIAAGLCGGGLFIYKRKQEENEYNW